MIVVIARVDLVAVHLLLTEIQIFEKNERIKENAFGEFSHSDATFISLEFKRAIFKSRLQQSLEGWKTNTGNT